MADCRRGDVHLYSIETFLPCSPMRPRPIFSLLLRNASSSERESSFADEKDSQTTTTTKTIPLLAFSLPFPEGNVGTWFVYFLVRINDDESGLGCRTEELGNRERV